ncbi:unnamed protein product [Blepharisma stoltei]|uniref:Uncharacterized protein n=1 Tax=Blepharisma stoltei TaxID=1481888 RepID=A0AAU9IRT0_9CILI|nr:unnamed protein product [Blepharisma stoltei]
MGGLALRKRSAELEINSRAACSAPQINPSPYDPPLMQTCQDYLNACQQGTTIYNLGRENARTNLIIYNTETETWISKIFETPQTLEFYTCLTQLPNGKLFCFGSCWQTGITVLIDTNGGVEVLPSGTPCQNSSCIYFNNSV